MPKLLNRMVFKQKSSTKSVLNHLDALVSYNPTTSKQKNVKKLLQYCKARLQKTNSFKDVKIIKNGDIYSLFASTKGTNHPTLLLQGHVDVVPAEKNYRKLSTDNDVIRGRGVHDMLFATACYLHFVESNSEKLTNLDIGIMLTGDEEIGGQYGVKTLLDEGYSADVCILPDSGDRFGELSISAKGMYNFSVSVNGKAHHGSRPWEGDGAANKLLRLLEELVKEFDHSDEHNSTIAITKLHAGDSINRGPADASANVDIRTKDSSELKKIKSKVLELCQKFDAEMELNIEDIGYQVDLKNKYIKSFLEMYEEHAGRPIEFHRAHGSSDARYFARKDIPVILFQPDGGGAHGDAEWLSAASLQKFYALLEEYILKTATINSDE